MTLSRRFQTVAMVALVGALAWIVFSLDVTKEMWREANLATAEAAAASEEAKQANRALEALSTDEMLKNNRRAVEAAAQKSIKEQQALAAKWRHAAGLIGPLEDRTDNPTGKRICRLRRDAASAMAEVSDAVAESSAVWLNAKIVDQRSGFAAMEPHVQRAESARAKANELRAAAKALEAEIQAER